MSSDQRVDRLRQQLHALGYLDAGVDRFVLAGAAESRGPMGVRARASVRVGVLGGLLLGPAAAIGLAARVPGLVERARDAVILAAYLAAMFSVAVAAASFFLSVLSAAFAGAADRGFATRARRVSGGAGVIVMLGCLAYLTVWWRNANAGFGWNAPVWTAFALIVAVAIGLLLGHAVRVATLGALATGAQRATVMPRSPATSWAAVVVSGAVAFAGAALLLVFSAPAAADRDVNHPRLVVGPEARRVTLVAIDGFDPETYAQLRDALPHLRQALGGARATLVPQDTSDPARAWTTIATGVSPEHHGVHALETRRLAGVTGPWRGGSRLVDLLTAATDAVRLTRPSLASREDRRAKTIWEVAEDAGLRTAVINWWASWPAPATGATVVTDRAVLRLEHGGALDAEIAPPALYETLRADWPRIQRQARADVRQAFGGGDGPAVEILRRAAELDATIAHLAQDVPNGALDLFAVYFPGLDIAQNALLGAAAGALPPSVAAGRIEALRAYYPFLDREIGPLLTPSANRTIIVVTQPGRVAAAAGGLIALSGDESIASTTDAGSASPLDVAPTVWRLLGLPLSRELGGAPVMWGASVAPVRYVPSYGRPFAPAAIRTGTPLDREMIDRLRSLGYVK